MRILLLLSFIFTTTIQAQNPSGRAKVLVIDQDIDTTELAKKYDVEKEAPANLKLPNLRARDKVFEGVTFPENWDHLKKDVFFLELKEKSIEELIKKYPDLKESDIKALKGKVS